VLNDNRRHFLRCGTLRLDLSKQLPLDSDNERLGIETHRAPLGRGQDTQDGRDVDTFAAVLASCEHKLLGDVYSVGSVPCGNHAVLRVEFHHDPLRAHQRQGTGTLHRLL
jgi:hypothetical protein